MARLRGQLDPNLAGRVGDYLFAGAWIDAWMGMTPDLLEGRFDVPGGSSGQTDGLYYWRRDAAYYVGEYLIGLPDDFLAHCEANNWTVPPVSEERLREIRDVFRPRENPDSGPQAN
jgi:hypothetical protein